MILQDMRLISEGFNDTQFKLLEWGCETGLRDFQVRAGRSCYALAATGLVVPNAKS